ncbi:hypothetical protein KP509_05G023800 [Ceratopteris richardii]|uniref:Uncharacterized protein n=1 Tax=Ceratopteris richardii TaxID=49495 RepID=A0A8T2UK35_CERRI|nr:hypothetical protein KP509_05G023800 [Ceratopteris richardii]
MEYPMPGSRETHEMVVVGDGMLLLSQQTNSTLVKVHLDRSTGRPLACKRYVIGSTWDGLHGLTASKAFSSCVWATLQFKSVVILVDPGADMNKQPSIKTHISLPPGVYGPHCIYEFGNDLWISCKDSGHVVRINWRNPSDHSVYPCSGHPIFVAVHPTSKDVYATLGSSSMIWRWKQDTHQTSEIHIPTTHGTTPVGLIQGPDKNVWFTLLGNSTHGSGTFGCIRPNGELQFLSLASPVGCKAGLIHLAFDYKRETLDSLPPGVHHLWIAGSSLIVSDDGYGVDAVFTVLVNVNEMKGRILSERAICLPTQRCGVHRILPHSEVLLISQLKACSLACVSGAAAFKPEISSGESIDRYNAFGQGINANSYSFDG